MKNEIDMSEYAKASPFKRVCAALIDLLIIILYLQVVTFVIIVTNNNKIALAISCIPLAIYKPVMEYFWGATVGKLALSIRVLNEDGQKLSLNRSYIRFIPFLLIVVVMIPLFSFQLEEIQNTIKENQDMSLAEVINQNKEKSLEFQERLEDIKGLPLLMSLVQLFFLTDILVMYFRRDVRALHDMMAKSYCIDLKTRRIESV